ncbi:MAG: hypothetical protein IPJ34_05010 [Myxococcales bacterium]|nr:hypothetical protein [Myxococcales bacterium]
MVTLRSLLPAFVLLFGCSSTAFEVGQGDAGDDAVDDDGSVVGDSSATDTGPRPDSATPDSVVDTTSPDTTSPDTTSPDTGTKPDTAITPDTGTPDTGTPDTGTVPDTAPDTKVDAVVDTGCVPTTTKACECGGVRTCGPDGTYGACLNVCLPSPARFICAYGKSGCTVDSCFDSNNCVAKCGCAADPGSTCVLSDPCWGVVCNGYVCPS